MATLKECILALVRSAPGLTDREIANRLLGSRAALQRVNKPARSLAFEGLIARRCRYDGKLGNYPLRSHRDHHGRPQVASRLKS